MDPIELGRSGVRVSRVIFGAMALSSQSREPTRRKDTIVAAIEAGITSIDTAPLYDYGRCEELLGEVLQGLHGVQILTKVGLRWDDDRGEVLYRFVDDQGRQRAVRRNSRPESIRLEVERSLQRLRVEVLDLVQVHHPDPDTPIADTMGALADLLHEGKLRAIGVSNYGAEQMRQAQLALGAIPLASNQVRYSLLDRAAEAEILPLARSERIGVLAYSPLAQGLLRSAPRGEAFAPDDGRRHAPRFHPSNLARVSTAVQAALEPIARAREVEVAQVALASLLAQPGLSAVIAGASSVEQATRNASALDLALSAEEQAVIRDAFARAQLDPNAGQGTLSRVRRRAQRLVDRVRRTLGRG